MTLEEIGLARKKKTKELLGEMKRKMDWLTTSLEGTAAWLCTKTKEITDRAEVREPKKKKSRRCMRGVLAIMGDRLKAPKCKRKGSKNV